MRYRQAGPQGSAQAPHRPAGAGSTAERARVHGATEQSRGSIPRAAEACLSDV